MDIASLQSFSDEFEKISANRYEREAFDKKMGGDTSAAAEAKRKYRKSHKPNFLGPLEANASDLKSLKRGDHISINNGPWQKMDRAVQARNVKMNARVHIGELSAGKKTGLGKSRSLLSRLGRSLKHFKHI